MEYLGNTSLEIFCEPANLAVIVLVLSLVLTEVRVGFVHRLARMLCVIASVFLLLFSLFPLGELVLRPLENSIPLYQYPEKIDGLILLTGDENAAVSEDRQTPIAGAAAQRHIHLARLAHQYPDAKIVISGATPNKGNPDGFSIKKVLAYNVLSMGIDPNRITFEEQSRDTYENAMFSKAQVNPTADEKWILVTSAYHMPRALLSFENAGWRLMPSPTDYMTQSTVAFDFPVSLSRQLRMLTLAWHEYMGLIVYRLYGWIDRLWL